MIIAVDFDGTCVTHEYPSVGREIGASYVLKELVKNGHRLVLNTMRGGGEVLDAAVGWFASHGIPLHGVNETPSQKSWTGSPKVYAQIYIDDAALGCPLVHRGIKSPFVDWLGVYRILAESGAIAGGESDAVVGQIAGEVEAVME